MIEQEIIEGGDYTIGLNGVAVIGNTFDNDFAIAETFGGIEDTYRRAFDEWKKDIKYMTALAMTLNHRGWGWYRKDDEKSKLYFDLWEKVDKYILDYDYDEETDTETYKHFNGKEISYYVRATD